MRTPLLVLAFLALAVSPAAHAQFGSDGSVTYGGVGVAFFDNDELSERLSTAGYGRLESDGVGVGTARYQFRGRLVGGVEGHTTGSESSEVGGIETTLSGRYALVNLGVDLVGSPTLRAYPLVGVGYGDLTLKLAPLAEADFDRILSDPDRGTSLTKRGFLFNAGVGGDVVVPFRVDDEGASTGLALGVRAGYLAAVGGDDWEQFATSGVTDAPGASLSGPYVRLLIGVGRSQ